MREVVDQCSQTCRVVVDHGQGHVAVLTEQASDAAAADLLAVPRCAPALARSLTARVVVVDHEPGGHDAVLSTGDSTARLAAPSLLFEHSMPVGKPNSIEAPELRVERPLGGSLAVGHGLLRRARTAVPTGRLARLGAALADAVDHLSVALRTCLRRRGSTSLRNSIAAAARFLRFGVAWTTAPGRIAVFACAALNHLAIAVRADPYLHAPSLPNSDHRSLAVMR